MPVIPRASRPQHPGAIVSRTDLSRAEKIALLTQLDFDLREGLVADDENMLAPTPPVVTLDEVYRALSALDARAFVPYPSPRR